MSSCYFVVPGYNGGVPRIPISERLNVVIDYTLMYRRIAKFSKITKSELCVAEFTKQFSFAIYNVSNKA